MWASTLWPLLSSTRNIALGRASTIVPSISMTPSFFAMSSAIHAAGRPGWYDPVGSSCDGSLRDDVLDRQNQPRDGARTHELMSRHSRIRQRHREPKCAGARDEL